MSSSYADNFVKATIKVSTPSSTPSTSSCDLSDLKAYVIKEGSILVKKMVESVSGELGDLSKKNLDSVVFPLPPKYG